VGDVDRELLSKIRCVMTEFLVGVDWEWFRKVLENCGMTREEFQNFMEGGKK